MLNKPETVYTIDMLIQKILDDEKQYDLSKIISAYEFAAKAHANQVRSSGEPYITHPLAVSFILLELGMDTDTICAAMLHDVVEDTDVTLEEVKKGFGQDVAMLVDGVTKLGKIPLFTKEEQQAENVRKILLAMSQDIRVIIIKLCDRLHNMRTLHYRPAHKQRNTALETMNIYAPIAHRLGMRTIKEEIEDLAFRYLDPYAYGEIEHTMNIRSDQREAFIESIKKQIAERFASEEFARPPQIDGRVKSVYSIYKKTFMHGKSIDEIYDIYAVRIIVDTVPECYNSLGIIHDMFKPIPNRFKDYIATPKSNMYQSLHTTVIGREGIPFEVQIRTWDMHHTAEFGIAAHWKYKEGNEIMEDESELSNWLRTIKDILDDPQPDAMDFLDAIKMNLFASEIFVFTPKGEIKTMPAGSTALDLAFLLHTELGCHCIGAKVNHKLVPLSHKLDSGDQVEILTSNSQRVQPSWINFATTARAKSKIQSILRKEGRELQKKGEQILKDFLENNSIDFTSSVADTLCEFHSIDKYDKLLSAIGDRSVILGEKDIDEINGRRKPASGKKWRKYVPFLSKDKGKQEESKPNYFIVTEGFNRKKPIYITDDSINQFVFRQCCHPIPGDDVLGFIDRKNRIEIHKRSCPVASKLKSGYGNRILDAKWDMHKRLLFDATIAIRGIDRIGMLNEVTKVISEQLNVNIHKITISCDQGIFDGSLEILVHDRDDVKVIMKKLKAIKGLQEIKQTV